MTTTEAAVLKRAMETVIGYHQARAERVLGWPIRAAFAGPFPLSDNYELIVHVEVLRGPTRFARFTIASTDTRLMLGEVASRIWSVVDQMEHPSQRWSREYHNDRWVRL